jgi:hypothetical protein
MNTVLKYKFILLLASAFAFVACNKDEQDPFTGKDSYIVTFSLQQSETVLHAAITGEVITITAPEGFALNNAKVAVRLSENAKMYPDPATITGWDEEQTFAVTAYNGAQTKYKYTVKRSGIAHSGTVKLETQADVDAFGQRGVTVLDGSLAIGRLAGTDSITSLAPLASLKEISYALTINPTCAVATMKGLENLENVGALQIGALPHLKTLTLPALKTAGGIDVQNTVTIVAEFPVLERVSKQFRLSCPLYQLRLPSLQSAGILTLGAASNASASLETISLPALEDVGENITVAYLKSVTKLDLPELKKVGGFAFNSMTLLSFIYAPKLEEATGTMNFSSMNGLTELSFPALKQVGTLTISSCKNLSILEVPKLETVKSLSVQNTPLNGMSVFVALKTAGTIALSNLPAGKAVNIPATVQSIDVLTIGLTTADAFIPEVNLAGASIGTLRLTGRAYQTKIIGDETFSGLLALEPSSSDDLLFPELEGLSEVDSLYVSSSNSYTYIKGIRKVRKGVYLGGYAREFSMPDMEEIGGNLTVSLSNLTSEEMDSVKFDKLKSVGGDFVLTMNTNVTKVLHCPALTTVGGNFNLSAGYDYSSSYTNYRGFETLNFPKLTDIGGKLTIYSGNSYYNNTQLKNLDGFAALTNVQAIEVSRMMAIESYEGLKKAFNTSITSPEQWKTANNAYNPTYQDLLDGKWRKENE